MAMINFMGGVGAAIEGYNKGAREQRADNKQQDVDAYEGKVREINTAQLPLAAEAKRLQLENEATDSRNAAELKPVQAQTKKILTQGEADMAPGAVDAAKKKQISDSAAEVFRVSEETYNGQKKAEIAQEEVRAGIGQRLLDGDTDSATAMLRSAYASPTLFPSISGKSPPVKVVVGAAPAGAIDIGGKPISGQALIMKMEDGSTQYMPPSFFAAALRRKQEAEQQASIKPVTAGTKLVNMKTGLEVFSNENGYIQDGVNPDGTPRMIRSPGRGAAGKEADPLSKTDAATLASINRQRDKTQASVLKEVENGSDPKKMSAYAKIMAGLDIEERAMYAKYEGVKPSAADDKLQFRSSLSPGAAVKPAGAGPGVASTGGAARVGGDAGVAGQLDTLQREAVKSESALKKATEQFNTPGFNKPENAEQVELVRASIVRHESDLKSIQSELSRIVPRGAAQARVGGVTPSAATATAPTPVAPTPIISAPATAPPPTAAPLTQYSAGRPSVSGALGSTIPAAPAAVQAAPRPLPVVGKSPQTMGDDFESPSARAALELRVKDARVGGAPLTRVEALRARQLRLIA